MENSSELEKHIGYWLRFVSNHVSLAFANKLSSYDLSIAEWVVLNLLNEQEQSPAVIAKKIGMTRGATSKVLDKLFNKQLIDRSESSKDRRFLEIKLTKKGKSMLPKLIKVADENDYHFFGHLSKEEKDTITNFLTDIVYKNRWKNIPIS